MTNEAISSDNAFPVESGEMRDLFAIQAPITADIVRETLGARNHIFVDIDRQQFFAVWTSLKYEFADAMIKAREAKSNG